MRGVAFLLSVPEPKRGRRQPSGRARRRSRCRRSRAGGARQPLRRVPQCVAERPLRDFRAGPVRGGGALWSPGVAASVLGPPGPDVSAALRMRGRRPCHSNRSVNGSNGDGGSCQRRAGGAGRAGRAARSAGRGGGRRLGETVLRRPRDAAAGGPAPGRERAREGGGGGPSEPSPSGARLGRAVRPHRARGSGAPGGSGRFAAAGAEGSRPQLLRCRRVRGAPSTRLRGGGVCSTARPGLLSPAGRLRTAPDVPINVCKRGQRVTDVLAGVKFVNARCQYAPCPKALFLGRKVFQLP